MKILTSKDKKKIVQQLNEQFGIENIHYILASFGKEKLKMFSGNLEARKIAELDRNICIENIGLYFAKIEKDGLRLTIDAIHLLQHQINKNIIELNEKQAQEWLQGLDLDIKAQRSYVIIKHKQDFLGCGKSTGEKIINYLPKERRIR